VVDRCVNIENRINEAVPPASRVKYNPVEFAVQFKIPLGYSTIQESRELN